MYFSVYFRFFKFLVTFLSFEFLTFYRGTYTQIIGSRYVSVCRVLIYVRLFGVLTF